MSLTYIPGYLLRQMIERENNTSKFKVMAGGSYGVDLSALEAARDSGVQTGGWCPQGWLTALPEGGVGSNPELKDFGLQETISTDFPTRTKRNIDQSDVTLLFGNIHSRGSLLARKTCKQLGKPLVMNESAEYIAGQIIANNWETINVAGNRLRSSDPSTQVLADLVYNTISEVIQILKDKQYI